MKPKTLAQGSSLVGGILLLAGGLAHTFAGWPALSSALPEGLDSQVRGAVAVGWIFGGVAMDTFGVLVLLAFAALRRGSSDIWWVPFTTGVFFALFGVGALIYRSLSTHFLAFVIVGLLLCGSFWARGTGEGGGG